MDMRPTFASHLISGQGTDPTSGQGSLFRPIHFLVKGRRKASRTRRVGDRYLLEVLLSLRANSQGCQGPVTTRRKSQL